MKEAELPILPFLDEIRDAIETNSVSILQASPGAGKSTEVPLALLKTLQSGKILLLEPRRVAARSLAQYLSKRLGEPVGKSIGYRMRGDTKASSDTRLEIVTEGLLTRMLVEDPELSGIKYVLFDEFHERSLQSDTALALSIESQKLFREDLRILIMSATLEGGELKKLFPKAPFIEVPGRIFPIETIYRGKPDRLESGILSAIGNALKNGEGDVLVFLPGRSEISRCFSRFEEEFTGIEAIALTADTSAGVASSLFEESTYRRVIFSTSVAETSVTLPYVRTVVDSGLSRYSIFNSSTGMDELVTRKVTEASAEQRRGRAGRVAAGTCYRLWNEGEVLLSHTEPEILRADLASFALDILLFGISKVEELILLDFPNRSSWEKAIELLKKLGAVDTEGRVTLHAGELSRFGVHPRIAHMLCRAKELGVPRTGVYAAAVLESTARYGETLSESVKRAATDKGFVKAHAERLLQQLGGELKGEEFPSECGKLLAAAYPERLAKCTSKGTYLLAVGGEVKLPEGSSLSSYEFISAGRIETPRIALGEAIGEGEIFESYPVENLREVVSDGERIRASLVSRVGEVIVSSKQAETTDEERRFFVNKLLQEKGIEEYLDKEARSFLYRLKWGAAHNALPKSWGNHSNIDDLLLEHAPAVNSQNELREFDWLSVLKTKFSYDQLKEFEKLLPESFSLATGNSAPIEYRSDGGVRIRVLLQELFGQKETPRVAGRISSIELLSPAKRPIQLTSDLASFWVNIYPQLRKQLMRDYPKHSWPEDPLTAKPVSKGLKRNEK